MIHLTIDGRAIETPEGTTVLRAAEKAGITIPTLCDHPDLTPFGGCRLCLVEVQGARNATTSCTLKASEGMVVETETPSLIQARRFILQLLLSSYHDSNYQPDGPETELLHWCHHYNVDVPTSMAKVPRFPVDSDPNPFIHVDLNKCIECTRCVRACSEIAGRFVWGMNGRGFNTHPSPGVGDGMLAARCESCGACVAYCPTGALESKISYDAGLTDRLVTTICTYCGVGCQFDLNVRDDEPGGRVVSVTSNPMAAVNGMHLCVKGRYGFDFIHHPDRLTQPLVRQYLLEEQETNKEGSGVNLKRAEDHSKLTHKRVNSPWVPVDWDTALSITARKLRETRDTFGSDSVGVLTSAKCLNEENYLMNKFARQVIGTNSIDHCARL